VMQGIWLTHWPQLIDRYTSDEAASTRSPCREVRAQHTNEGESSLNVAFGSMADIQPGTPTECYARIVDVQWVRSKAWRSDSGDLLMGVPQGWAVDGWPRASGVWGFSPPHRALRDRAWV
jgi:hypothetical protein